GHASRVTCVCFSPRDSTILASAGDDGIARLRDSRTGQELAALKVQGHQGGPPDRAEMDMDSICFSFDGQTLAGASLGKITLWDVPNPRERLSFQAQRAVLSSVCFSPDGKTLASASRLDPTVKLWDARTGAELATLTGHTHGVYCVCFSPEGKS